MTSLRNLLSASFLAASILAGGPALAMDGSGDGSPAGHARTQAPAGPCSAIHQHASPAGHDGAATPAACGCGHASGASGWQKSPEDLDREGLGYRAG